MELKPEFGYNIQSFKGRLEEGERKMKYIREQQAQGKIRAISAGYYSISAGYQTEFFQLEALAKVGAVPMEEFNPLKERFATLIRFDAGRIEERSQAYIDGGSGRDTEARKYGMSTSYENNFLKAILPYFEEE